MLCELCLPFVRPGGLFIAMKGPEGGAELEEARRAIAELGGGEAEVRPYGRAGDGAAPRRRDNQKNRPHAGKVPAQMGEDIKKAPLGT